MTTPASDLAGSAPASSPLRSGRLHWLVTALVSLAFASNAVDLAAMSFALPGVRREWGLSAQQLGIVAAAVSAGQVSGSLLIGWLADRLGRRGVLTGTIALASVAVGLSAVAPNAALVTLLWFVTGVGISGVAPVATSLLGEFAPPRVRGQLMAWTQVCWASGWCITAAGGAALATNLGWRWVIVLGALPIALAVLSWKLTPESPRFLLAHGRRAEAEALQRDLQTRYGVHVPLPEQQRANQRSHPFSNVRELLGPVFRRRTLTLWLTFFTMVASFNGPILWLPTILTTTTGNEALAARSSLIVGLFMLPASLLAVLFIERAGRRRLLMASLAIASAGTLLLGIAGSEALVILGGGALAAGALAAWPIMLGYTAELYPTRVRATAAGWAGVVSRSGGIFAPLLIGALLSTFSSGLTLALTVFAVLLALAVVLVAVQGEETRGRTLEELAG